ncbi:hypothetical protein QQG10_01930 [Melissococcus plutonius]|nr:hypothetical protein [Melissococcus plutonius]
MTIFIQKIKKLFELFSTYITPPIFAVLFIGILTCILLFISPINGLADNGQYFYVLNSNSLFINNPNTYPYADYFQKTYGIMQYFNQTSTKFVSVQQLFITLAIWLNKLFFSKTVFDIRFLGMVYLIFFLPAIYLLIKGLTAGVSIQKSYLMALLVIFILGDASYTIFFNSFYKEAVSYLASLYIFASCIYFYRGTKKRKEKVGMLVLLLISSIMLIGTSHQEYILVIGLVIVGIGLFKYMNIRASRFFLSFLLLWMLGTTLLATIFIPNPFQEQDLYHSLSRGVMLETDKPDKRLSEGKINPQYGLEKGTSYHENYSPVSPKSSQVKKNLLNKTGLFWILNNYLHHPNEFQAMLNLDMQDIYFVKPKELGNYEKTNHYKPKQQVNFFTLYNRINAATFPKEFNFYLLFIIVIVGIYGVGLYKGIKLNCTWMIFRFFFILGFSINLLLVFLLSVIISGDSNLVLHLFLASFYIDCLTILLLSDILGQRVWSDDQANEEAIVSYEKN